jgi:DNA repair protein RecO (recombination protein O)
MRVHSQAAFVLHCRPFRETSLIVEVFTRDFGRLGLVARGARDIRSRRRALLLPFQLLQIGWSGKGELPLLTGIEMLSGARELVGQQRYAAFYLNELLLRLLHRHDPHEMLFDSFSDTLDALYQGEDTQQVLRRFEKRLLSDTGYGLILTHEANSTKPIQPLVVYNYVRELGPQPVDASQAVGLKILGQSLIDLHNEHFTDRRSLQEAKQLIRFLIDGQLAGRHLRSRHVLHQVISSLTQQPG